MKKTIRLSSLFEFGIDFAATSNVTGVGTSPNASPADREQGRRRSLSGCCVTREKKPKKR